MNIFCAGHAFLPDGRLLVAGGHLKDSDGIDAALLYDPGAGEAGTWTATAAMAGRRWYPTATTAPDGSIVVLDGSYIDDAGQTLHVTVPEVWTDGAWRELDEFPDEVLDLYPRVHIAPDGSAFVSGPLETDVVPRSGHRTLAQQRRTAEAQATRLRPGRHVRRRQDPLHRRGRRRRPAHQPGRENQPHPAAAGVETRGRHAFCAPPAQRDRAARRHRPGHRRNPRRRVQQPRPGQPVHTAELWDPDTGAWTELAAESVDRCYHATTVLLPDATVLSAGGGEFKLPGGAENDPQDTHHDAQIFRPPYLFRDGTRPEISDAPTTVEYGSTFAVQTAHAPDIAKVTLLRLASVTHSFDQSQHINVLEFRADATTLTVTAPATPNVCPPGPYMLFILNTVGIPSVARILRIQQFRPASIPAADTAAAFGAAAPAGRHHRSGVGAYAARAAAAVEKATGTAVLVGITATCPYGLGACWGGAREALAALDGVELVNPVPNTEDSTAQVFLRNAGLPDLRGWSRQFRTAVSGRYGLRGFEVTVVGELRHQRRATRALPPLRSGRPYGCCRSGRRTSCSGATPPTPASR